MNLPVDPGEKYGLVGLDARTRFHGVLDLGGGLFAIGRGGVTLPDHWKEWLGSIETRRIEESELVLLAKSASATPEVLDGENEHLVNRAKWLVWGLLAVGKLAMGGEGAELSGGHADGELSVRRHGRLGPFIHVSGFLPDVITDEHLRRAAALSRNLGEIVRSPGMRRVKLAIRTFWTAFEEMDLGQRIHQFVRVVSEGFANSSGRADFMRRTAAFTGRRASVVRRQLYLMRNNAEHFNPPDRKLSRLSIRRSWERAHLRSHNAEALARHCVSRFVEDRRLWPHFRADAKVEAFWKQSDRECARWWGAPLNMEQAVATFDPKYVRDEG